MKNRANEIEITIEIDGRTYTGGYSINSKVVTVHSIHGSASTQLGGLPTASLARTLLREIVRGAKSRGEL